MAGAAGTGTAPGATATGTAAGDEIRYPFAAPPAPGEAVEVAEGVLWLRLPLPMVLDHVNIYALDDGDGWTLIDSGLDTRRTREALSAAFAGPLAGRPLRRVLVTHYHPDHIGLAGWLQRRGAELLTTRTSWLFARMLTLDEQPRPVPEVLDFWRGAGMDPALLARRAVERPFNFADVVAPLPLGYTRIAAGDRLRIGGRDWRVRIGHGHAPEHATLWQEDGPLVIGGDQLLPSISANIGVYATEPMADPLGEWLQSCRAFEPLARPDQLVLPGHKLPFTGLPLRLRQMIDNHAGALMRLERHLHRPRSAAECFLPLFRREIGEGEYGLALVEAVAHLNHLLHAGRVVRERGEEGVWLWRMKT
ncbi:MBL fold metallo-hydrolase [Albidovulum sp.]